MTPKDLVEENSLYDSKCSVVIPDVFSNDNFISYSVKFICLHEDT